MKLVIDPKIQNTLVREKIRFIENTGKRFVYDVSVPDGHNYIANGLVAHNTVLGTFISCKLGVKTLIVAHQDDLLRNFLKTYVGMTNLKQLQKEHGKPIVQLINDVSEITKHTQVALITYQKFIRKENAVKRISKYLNKMGFSLLIVDEAHSGSALAYSRFLNKINVRYKLALSATPLRKDCVVKGTKIITENGIKNIEDIKLNDRVLSYNHNTKTEEYKEVLKLHKRSSTKLLKICYGNNYIVCTEDHEIWSSDKQSYIKAKDLSIGEELFCK